MSIPPLDGDARTAGTMPVWRVDGSKASETALYKPDSLAPAAGNPPDSEDRFGFFDLLDIVNPLQHLPIVSFIYREITDDRIKPVSQIAGGGLYGGLIGAAASTVNVIVEQETGKDIPGNLVSLVTGDDLSRERSDSSLHTTSAHLADPVLSEPLPDLSPAATGASSNPEPRKTASAADLPGTVVALADLRKPAMTSFVLNT